MFVKCPCQYCNGFIEFEADDLSEENSVIPCPLCGLETKLFIPPTAAGSNVPVPVVEPKNEMPVGTRILFGIIGIAIVVIPLALFVHHQNEVAQAKRNYQEMINPTPTFTEIEEAKQAARKQHEDYIRWEATNGIAEGEFEYATDTLAVAYLAPSLTNEAVKWLQKAADQGYQPAIELLATHEPKSQLDSIDSFLWENKGTDLSETEEDLTSTYNPEVFNGEKYISYDRSITIANGKIVLKAEDKIHDDNDRELTDLMSKEAANNKIYIELGKEAQINPIFEKFLDWAATAKENNVEKFDKQILCTTNHFGEPLRSAQVILTYTFSWHDNQAGLLINDSSRESVASFTTEDVLSLQKLLLRLPQMKQKLVTAIRDKETQKNLFH